MFTGIIEHTGTVSEVIKTGSNRSFWILSPISHTLKIDQSICHDGVCLTVEKLSNEGHQVTAVAETIKKTTLGDWKKGRVINLERCLLAGSRIDGHLVQGHVDGKLTCLSVKKKKGSWEFEFDLPGKMAPLVIEKGSVCINGISLTCFDVKKKSFRVAIIPFTFEHTNMRSLKKGDQVNIEYDMVGKFLQRKLSLTKKKS